MYLYRADTKSANSLQASSPYLNGEYGVAQKRLCKFCLYNLRSPMAIHKEPLTWDHARGSYNCHGSELLS